MNISHQFSRLWNPATKSASSSTARLTSLVRQRGSRRSTTSASTVPLVYSLPVLLMMAACSARQWRRQVRDRAAAWGFASRRISLQIRMSPFRGGHRHHQQGHPGFQARLHAQHTVVGQARHRVPGKPLNGEEARLIGHLQGGSAEGGSSPKERNSRVSSGAAWE